MFISFGWQKSNSDEQYFQLYTGIKMFTQCKNSLEEPTNFGVKYTMLGIFYLYKLYISYHDNIYKFKIENGRGTKFFVDCYIHLH